VTCFRVTRSRGAARFVKRPRPDPALVQPTSPRSETRQLQRQCRRGGSCTAKISFTPTLVGSVSGAGEHLQQQQQSTGLCWPHRNRRGAGEQRADKPQFHRRDDRDVERSPDLRDHQQYDEHGPNQLNHNNNTNPATLSSVVPSGDFQIQASGTTCSLTGGNSALASFRIGMSGSGSCALGHFGPVSRGGQRGLPGRVPRWHLMGWEKTRWQTRSNVHWHTRS